VWLAVHYRAADRVSGGDLARLLDNTPAPGEESPGTTRPTEGPANSEDKHE
jgi:hypothetical protein